ncbi:MAG: DsbA family protein [Deltaproteobacteria bacterium]|nr:DsbA family protein [Deltaproteobacteria bacterium]
MIMKAKKALFMVLAAVLLVGSTAAYASEDVQSLRKDVEVLRNDMDEIKRVLISILPVLVKHEGVDGSPQVVPPQRVETPQSATVSIDGSPSMGKSDVSIVLVEFSDYECPFCARFNAEVLKQVKREYIDTGRLRFVYKDFPLPFHQNAMKASMAARCAGEEGRYWEMHDALLENQQNLGDVDGLVKRTGLNAATFNECMKSRKYEDAVQMDLNDGRALGINGTPTFILGRLDASGKVTGDVIQGAMPYAVFKTKIEALLK